MSNQLRRLAMILITSLVITLIVTMAIIETIGANEEAVIDVSVVMGAITAITTLAKGGNKDGHN